MKSSALVILLFGLILFCSAQKQEVYSNSKGAIKGYDPVAYFQSNEPMEGSDKFSTEWGNAIWKFTSQENLDLFKKNPDMYVPQFGGYCAYAVANGYTYRSDPTAWKIVDGKLYLNYSSNIQKKWEANQEQFIKQGIENWPTVLDK